MFLRTHGRPTCVFVSTALLLIRIGPVVASSEVRASAVPVMERGLSMTVSMHVFVFAASLQFRTCLFRVLTDLHVSKAQQ